jgi:hypothetical protein
VGRPDDLHVLLRHRLSISREATPVGRVRGSESRLALNRLSMRSLEDVDRREDDDPHDVTQPRIGRFVPEIGRWDPLGHAWHWRSLAHDWRMGMGATASRHSLLLSRESRSAA